MLRFLVLQCIWLPWVDAASISIFGGVESAHQYTRYPQSSRQSSRTEEAFSLFHFPLGHFPPGFNLSSYEHLRTEQPGAYLYLEMMHKHDIDVLPVNDTRTAVEVKLLLKLTQIVDVDEKNQIMTTNVWLRHEWHDSSLEWDPSLHGGVETIYLPADHVWLPDTILYNNADGDYHIKVQTKVEVHYNGVIVWEPPAIYKSFCPINVEFFPYDTQICQLKFGPWTEDVSKVDYYLMSSEEKYVDLTYNFHIRRKTLFYTINLIIPCIMISFLTVLVFYLPCQSGEKVTLSISTLLSLTWFILLLSEIIPPTSLSLPLMGKYLLFTMALVTFSIAVTVIVLYNHFRHPYAYAMPYWVRYVFLDVLPKLMFFQTIFNDQQLRILAAEAAEAEVAAATPTTTAGAKPNRLRYSRNSVVYNKLFQQPDADEIADEESTNENTTSSNTTTPSPEVGGGGRVGGGGEGGGYKWRRNSLFFKRKGGRMGNREFMRMRYGALLSCHEEGEFIIKQALPALDQYMALPQVREAMKAIHYISRRYRIGDIEGRMKGDWEAVSRVLDRLFLIIFSAASSLGTIAILLVAPSLYDTTPPLGASDPHEITDKVYRNFTNV